MIRLEGRASLRRAVLLLLLLVAVAALTAAGTLTGWADDDAEIFGSNIELTAADVPIPQPADTLDPPAAFPFGPAEGDTARGPLLRHAADAFAPPAAPPAERDAVEAPPPGPPGEVFPAFPPMVPVGPMTTTGLAPACPTMAFDGTAWLPGVACPEWMDRCDPRWEVARPIPWQALAQGEYIGPARLPHVPEYRLRVDDVVEFVYRLTRVKSTAPYRLNVGDTLRLESLTDPNLNREVLVQPDGQITVPLLGQVPAAGLTIAELRDHLESRREFVRRPSITVTPTKLNTRLEELRATVDSRFGAGGQSRQVKVTPEGTVQLPAIGSVPAQGLTLDELKMEVEYRYLEIVEGLEVTPILVQRAPRFVYVIGEVGAPGRIPLEAPTTVMQALAMAGSWNIGARLDHIVVLRRDDHWNLMATRLDLHDALFGKRPCPADEIWLRDSDIVIVPKRPIQWTGDLVELYFTRTIYRVAPIIYSFNFNSTSVL